MKSRVAILLQLDAEQSRRLVALQQTFAQACNSLAPLVRDTRCWNRVALHHMAYKLLRERFPELGSQMACNVIYSVSRSARLVFQRRDSPFHVQRWGERVLPLLHFTPEAPVYFDRHTLSLKQGLLSMFTLDGRMRFELKLQDDAERLFHEERLREVVLERKGEGFGLSFSFSDAGPDDEVPGEAPWPEYLLVTTDNHPNPRSMAHVLAAPAAQAGAEPV